jgi:hypothetical protein
VKEYVAQITGEVKFTRQPEALSLTGRTETLRTFAVKSHQISSSGAHGGVERATPELSIVIAMMAFQFELQVNQLDALSRASA